MCVCAVNLKTYNKRTILPKTKFPYIEVQINTNKFFIMLLIEVGKKICKIYRDTERDESLVLEKLKIIIFEPFLITN